MVLLIDTRYFLSDELYSVISLSVKEEKKEETEGYQFVITTSVTKLKITRAAYSSDHENDYLNLF